MPEAITERPDITADGFHPPRWLVLTAAAVILAAGVASAAFNFDLWTAQAPRFDIATPRAAATANASAALQAVPLGALVVADRSALPPPAAVKPTPKIAEEEEAPVLIAPVVAPVETAPVIPADTAGLY